jgi:hypothetical protein
MSTPEERFAEAVRASGFDASIRNLRLRGWGTASDFVAAALRDPRVAAAYCCHTPRPGEAVVCVVPKSGEDAAAILRDACECLNEIRPVFMQLLIVAPGTDGALVPEPLPPLPDPWPVRLAWRIVLLWRRLRRRGA